MRLKTILNPRSVLGILRLAVPAVLLAWGVLGGRADAADRDFSVTNETSFEIMVSVDFKNCGNEENVAIDPGETHGFVRGSHCNVKLVVAWATDTPEGKAAGAAGKSIRKTDGVARQNGFVVTFDKKSKKFLVEGGTVTM